MYITDYENNDNNLSNINMEKRSILTLWASFWNRPNRQNCSNKPNSQDISDNSDNSEKSNGLEDNSTKDLNPDETLKSSIVEENDEDEYDEEDIDDEDNINTVEEPVSNVDDKKDEKDSTNDEITTIVVDNLKEKSNNTIECTKDCDINYHINGTSVNDNIFNDTILVENPSIDNNDVNSNKTIDMSNTKNIKNNTYDRSNLNCTISIVLIIVALAVVGGCLFIKRLKRTKSSGKEDLSIVVEYDADKDVSMTEEDKQNNYRIIEVDKLENQEESAEDNNNTTTNQKGVQINEGLYSPKQSYGGHKVINALHDLNAFHDIIFDSKTIITFVSTDVVESNLDLEDDSEIGSTVLL